MTSCLDCPKALAWILFSLPLSKSPWIKLLSSVPAHFRWVFTAHSCSSNSKDFPFFKGLSRKLCRQRHSMWAQLRLHSSESISIAFDPHAHRSGSPKAEWFLPIYSVPHHGLGRGENLGRIKKEKLGKGFKRKKGGKKERKEERK